MARVFLIVLAFLLVLLAAAVLVVGLFPPKPRQAPVEHVLPNDRFHTQ